MPILAPYPLPSSPSSLTLPASQRAIYLLFISDDDVTTGKPWCPDVRAALPFVEEVFGKEGNEGAVVGYVYVGQKPEWKSPTNTYRTTWRINGIPTLVRYAPSTDGSEIVETGRLVDTDIRGEKLAAFVKEERVGEKL